ncbi:MAG: hypothetical protein M3Z64_01290 [Verrucomicrobiota bacterium]|nr:hypothetical protein [Verrucomicrobiota bacterium]
MHTKSLSELGIFSPRALAAFAFWSAGGLLALVSFAAPAPATGTLSTSNRTVTYTDSTGAPANPSPIATGVPNCGPTGALCSTFKLTIDPSVGLATTNYDPTKNQIAIQFSWSVATVDYDCFVENFDGRCGCEKPINRGSVDDHPAGDHASRLV